MPDITNDVLPNVPASVNVSFPRNVDGVYDGSRYGLTVALADLALTQYAGYFGHIGTYLIHSTAFGTITSATASYISITTNTNSLPPSSDWITKVGTTAAYSGGTTYVKGNTATSGGVTYLYINVTPTSGNAPPNGTYWLALGASIVNLGDWNTTTAYVVGNEVVAPDNLTELVALAEQIAKDFYLWKLAASLELRLPSYILLAADGAHDFEYWGSAATTVIHRSGWEPDFGEFWHSGSGGSGDGTPPPIQIITPAGTATGDPNFVFTPVGGITISGASNVVTFTVVGMTVPNGTMCGDILVWDTTVSQWVVFHKGAAPDGYILTLDSSSPYCVSWQKPCCPDNPPVRKWYCLKAPDANPSQPCCDVPVPASLNMRYIVGDTGDERTMTYDGGTDKWVAGGAAIGSCAADLFKLSCVDGVWTLTVDATSYAAADGGSCDPFIQTFFGVDLTACGYGPGTVIQVAG